MLELDFDYAGCIRNSEKVSWKVDDVMPPGTRLDFGRTFLPEGLAQTWSIPCLKNYQKLKLNQISANAYLNLFAFVEEFILATMVKHAQTDMFDGKGSVRALVRVAEEEAKHQELFHRYREAFDRDFGHPCGVLDSATAVAGVILAKSPIGVMMVILHIELFTQQHYLECVKDNAEVDPFFSSLLKNHFLEEAQHARVDALQLDKLARAATPAEIVTAFDDYLGILSAFDGLLAEQSQLDVKSLEAASGVTFSEADARMVTDSQQRAYRKTFLTYGMTNPQFLAYLGQISPAGQARVKLATALYDEQAAAASSSRPVVAPAGASAVSSAAPRTPPARGAPRPLDTEIDVGPLPTAPLVATTPAVTLPAVPLSPAAAPAAPAAAPAAKARPLPAPEATVKTTAPLPPDIVRALPSPTAKPSSSPSSPPASSSSSSPGRPPLAAVPVRPTGVVPRVVAPGAGPAAGDGPRPNTVADDDRTLDRELSISAAEIARAAATDLAANGSLVIEVPVDAVIFVNGIERGRGPQRVESLDRNAKLVVRVLCPGHAPWSGSVNLEGKPAAKIRPSLKRTDKTVG
ncbi:MAG: hypothetical protein Q8O67_09570 [Deltaproteobacteria bacterium]|nr:hypothetical protein [Deltaproteobacteria bacterium]